MVSRKTNVGRDFCRLSTSQSEQSPGTSLLLWGSPLICGQWVVHSFCSHVGDIPVYTKQSLKSPEYPYISSLRHSAPLSLLRKP